MPGEASGGPKSLSSTSQPTKTVLPSRSNRIRKLVRIGIVLGAVAFCAVGSSVWLATKAHEIKTELVAATLLIPSFKSELILKDEQASRVILQEIRHHTEAAQKSASAPLWKAASQLPLIGPNFSAVSELALSTNEVVSRAGIPLLDVVSTLDWDTIAPVNGKLNVAPLAAASPKLVAAAHTVELTHARLDGIDETRLLHEVSQPLAEARRSLDEIRHPLSAAASASKIVPSMLGADGARNYLILVQNSAEVRATGGLPGALAVVSVDNGTISLTAQSSGSAMGKFSPPLDVDPVQTQIFTTRLGAYISDVNLTPDFPTAAKSAKLMWQKRFGTHIDGVVALDTVVLAHLLHASGPVRLNDNILPSGLTGLPSSLTSDNVVRTLLSDVYSMLPSNDSQDAYFTSVSQEVFKAVTSGEVPGEKIMAALAKSTAENRILVWSDHQIEQNVLGKTVVSGSVTGPTIGGASFGVYFNDGTGAKMDYYIKRTVELAKTCTSNGYSDYRVRIKVTNAAPQNAAVSLPTAVTGGGLQGTPPGRVETNVIAYGPAQARIEGATVDGVKAPVGSFLHAQRPIGIVRTNLGPGQSSLVELNFSQVVQNQDPRLRLTPTIEDPAKISKITGSHTSSCNTNR